MAADAATIFELIADPSRQPEWDGMDNLVAAAAGQRVRALRRPARAHVEVRRAGQRGSRFPGRDGDLLAPTALYGRSPRVEIRGTYR